jgi:hypothetical protein
LRGILPFSSTEYSAQFDGGRSTTNSLAEAWSPDTTRAGRIDVTQPVLRDLVWNEPWTRMRTSRTAAAVERGRVPRAVMDTVQRIEDAYWS